MSTSLGQRRALRLVDQNGACVNERIYRADVDNVKPFRTELERLQGQWESSLALGLDTELHIIDVAASK
jgi:hypothetical protein